MKSQNKDPFNPFKDGENLMELDLLLNEVISHIIEHFGSIFGSEADPESEYNDLLEEIVFSKFYMSYEEFLKFSKVFVDNGLAEISDELANELILFSVMPLFYNQIGKGKIKNMMKASKGTVHLYALQKNIEIGKGKNAKIRFPPIDGFIGDDVKLGVIFDAMTLNQSNEKIYKLLEKRTSKVNADLSVEEQAKEFIEKLNLLSNTFGFIQVNLPSKSVFESLIVRHLYFIIRKEKLIDEISPDKKTDANITRLIIDLFRAGGYYLEEKDNSQDQMRMINNTYHRKSRKTWEDKIEKFFNRN